jgi:putative lipoic acid-binding regulatory protein
MPANVGSERAVAVEELLEFPTRFAFKAVGPNGERFVADARGAARAALGPERPLQHRARPSRQGTYVSVTLTARVENADELRAVYAGLRAVAGVITVL